MKLPSARNKLPKKGCSICCCRLRLPHPTATPRPKARAERPIAHATNCARSFAKASSTNGWWKWKCASAPCRLLKLSLIRASKRWISTSRHALRLFRPAKEKEKNDCVGGFRLLDPRRREQADRHGSRHAHRHRAGRADGHHLHRRNR